LSLETSQTTLTSAYRTPNDSLIPQISARSNRTVVCTIPSTSSLPHGRRVAGRVRTSLIANLSTVEPMAGLRPVQRSAGICCVFVVDTMTTVYDTRASDPRCTSIFHVRGFNFQPICSVRGQSAAIICNTDQINSVKPGARSSRRRLHRPSTTCWPTQWTSFGKGCSNVRVHLMYTNLGYIVVKKIIDLQKKMTCSGVSIPCLPPSHVVQEWVL
jgi:hypothetical protein